MKAHLIFGALTTPRKIEVVKVLLNGPLTVSEIQSQTKYPQAIVSQMLIALKNAGLATVTQAGTRRTYALRSPETMGFLIATAQTLILTSK